MRSPRRGARDARWRDGVDAGGDSTAIRFSCRIDEPVGAVPRATRKVSLPVGTTGKVPPRGRTRRTSFGPPHRSTAYAANPMKPSVKNRPDGPIATHPQPGRESPGMSAC